jgi:hypothetical protein
VRSQHRPYRDAQNDYWKARAHRARRVLAFRRLVRIAAILVAVVVVIGGAGYAVHRADPGLPVPVFASRHDYHDPAQLADAIAEQENVPNVSCSLFLSPQWYMCVGFTGDDGTTAGWNVMVSTDGRSYRLASRSSTSAGPNGSASAQAAPSTSTKTSSAAAGASTQAGQAAPSLIGTLTVTEPHGGIQAGSPQSLSFGPGNALAVFNGYSVDLWNIAAKNRVATFTDPDQNADDMSDSLAFGPDDTLALGTGDGHVYLWNAATESRIATFTDPDNSGPDVAAVAFGPAGALAFFDGSRVYLWNTATKNLLATFTDPDQSGGAVPGGSLAFGPAGALALGSGNGDVYLWKARCSGPCDQVQSSSA